MPLLTMRGITKSFPGVKALIDVDFTLAAGEIHALLGENGAGKSTLIKVLTGVESLDGGAISLLGNSIRPKNPLEAQSCGISTVYQEVNLCTNLTVAENIYIGREPIKHGRIDWKTMRTKAEKLLERFELKLDVTQTLDHYSVAIQQMVAIARAVDVSAKILILDEPTSSLDDVETHKLFDVMKMLKQQGMGIVFVTHFLDQVYEVSDRITVLRNGELVGAWDTAQLPRLALVGKMIGKEYDELSTLSPVDEAVDEEHEIYLSAHSLASTALKPFDVSVHQGEVMGIAGLLGSGRSEMMRLFFGADKAEQGHLVVEAQNVTFTSQLDAIRSGIAFCPENRKTEGIVGDLSIRENIILALQAKKGMLHAISRREAEKIADEYIRKLQIKTPSQEQAIKNLSGGNQQKVILGRWLATNPSLLMLDEPTRGIDVGTKAEIQKIVVDLAQKGMAIIFVSSELDEMLRCCTRMTIMRDQQKIGELSGAQIDKNKIMKMIAGGAVA
ncbi:MAG: sugar ABC transporter ATP-binding protein [Clostridia bacterium]